MDEDTKGAVSFKFRELYYGFYNIGNVDFNTLDFFENKKLSNDEINKITEQINIYLVN